jgi:hypothetical protein
MDDLVAENCPACGAPILEMDIRCGACGIGLTSTAAQRRVGSIVLEQYEITDILGQGGMSVVYQGRHRMTGQAVALKILPPELAVHAHMKSRFIEEARALAQLDHPGIVHLYNFGEEGDCFVLAMQLVSGQTWERLILERGKLDWRTTAEIAIDVLSALDYAHSRGVIHRDMKPSNVVVREGAGAMVMDFGIAKMTTSTKLTATGQTMGTVRYMSPEQVRAATLDFRTDLYSLAVTMYESLTGQTPFDGASHFEIMTSHLAKAAEPIRDRAPDCPPELEALVLQGMAKDPDARPASAAEFCEALIAILAAAPPERSASARPVIHRAPTPRPGTLRPGTARPGTARLPPRRAAVRGSTVWIGLAALVALAAGATLAWRFKARRVAAASASPPRSEPPDAATPPAPAEDDWPAPFLLPELTFAVDQRFEAERLRVLSVAPRPAAEIRDRFVAAQDRFFDLLERAGAGAVTRQPLNVVIVPREVMCDRRLDEKGAVRPGCEDSGMFLRFRDRTAYLADLPERLPVNLADAAAQNVCLHAAVSTPCLEALETYSEELVRPAPRATPKAKPRGGKAKARRSRTK